MAAPLSRGARLTALWKQGWNEIPEVMGSCIMGLIALPLCATAAYRYIKNDGDNRRYKLNYTVMRSDDPRVAKIHKD